MACLERAWHSSDTTRPPCDPGRQGRPLPMPGDREAPGAALAAPRPKCKKSHANLYTIKRHDYIFERFGSINLVKPIEEDALAARGTIPTVENFLKSIFPG